MNRRATKTIRRQSNPIKKAAVNALVYSLAMAIYGAGIVWRFFHPPNADSILSEARREGSTDIYIQKGDLEFCLLIAHEPGLGYYLKHLTRLKNNQTNFTWHSTWLSLGDRSKLDRTVGDDTSWICSVGLFVSPDLAHIGVREFLRTGLRAPELDWIDPGEIPEGGNW